VKSTRDTPKVNRTPQKWGSDLGTVKMFHVEQFAYYAHISQKMTDFWHPAQAFPTAADSLAIKKTLCFEDAKQE
jgi:hypothetical protein